MTKTPKLVSKENIASNDSSLKNLSFELLIKSKINNFFVNKEIIYGVHLSLFGYCLIATVDKAICKIDFLREEDIEESASSLNLRKELIVNLKQEFIGAKLNHSHKLSLPYLNRIFDNSNTENLKVLLKGTEFQIKVWQALTRLNFGELTTYQAIAEHINEDKASRAIGNAIAKNSLAYLIPCHRVINKSGLIGNYRWGRDLKVKIINYERIDKKI